MCPGSIREEARFPEPPEGAAATDGTHSHTLLERCIKEGTDPLGYVGHTLTDHAGTFTVDAERAARVDVAVQYIKSRVGYHPPIAEQRVFPDGLVLRDDLSGTVDCQIPDKSVYEIIDYKDGMAPVAAKDNPQLELYAIGVLAGLATENYPKVFRQTIIQPKLAVRGMPVISSHDISTKELLARVEVVKYEASLTDLPDAPLVPGESQCKYCKAKGSCAALAGKVMGEVSLMFSPVTPAAVTPEVIPAGVLDPAQQAAAQDPTTMSEQQLRQILEAAPLVRQLLEGVEVEVLRRLQAGQAFPGFKLVQGRGSRKWALPDDEIAKKLTQMGAPKAAVYKTTLVTPAQAEDLTWDKKGEHQKFSEIQVKRMQTEYVVKSAGKLTVAPESDPRPAVVVDASSMFGSVEAPPAEIPLWLQAQQDHPPRPVPAWLS